MAAVGRVGIVGGSIGGCAAAVSLSRRGWDVEVLERAGGDLVGRGAGIGTFAPFLDALVDRDLIGAELHRFDARPVRWVARDARSRAVRLHGSDPAGLPMSWLTWGDLYRQLRSRVPPGVYAGGHAVTEIALDGRRPSLQLADGSRRHYDLVLCADGYRSLGRATLFPQAALQYRGYVLWRGLVPHAAAAGTEVLEERAVRCGYRGGHGVFYLVPSPRRDRGDGGRDVNWVLYLQVPGTELAALLTDRHGRTSPGSVAAGMLAPEREAALQAWAAEVLPEALARVVEASRDTFVQAIFSVTVPGYHRERVCLIGDAGTLHPPFSGSGVFKAISNAVELADRLHARDDVDDALARWDAAQVRAAATFDAVATVFERELVFDMPDLGAFDDDAFTAWQRAVWGQLPPAPA